MTDCGDCNLCNREVESVIQAAAAGESCVCKRAGGTIESKRNEVGDFVQDEDVNECGPNVA